MAKSTSLLSKAVMVEKEVELPTSTGTVTGPTVAATAGTDSATGDSHREGPCGLGGLTDGSDKQAENTRPIPAG